MYCPAKRLQKLRRQVYLLQLVVKRFWLLAPSEGRADVSGDDMEIDEEDQKFKFIFWDLALFTSYLVVKWY